MVIFYSYVKLPEGNEGKTMPWIFSTRLGMVYLYHLMVMTGGWFMALFFFETHITHSSWCGTDALDQSSTDLVNTIQAEWRQYLAVIKVPAHATLEEMFGIVFNRTWLCLKIRVPPIPMGAPSPFFHGDSGPIFRPPPEVAPLDPSRIKSDCELRKLVLV